MNEFHETESASRAPAEGQIVFVQGGVAQYRNGLFYTGMEDPRYARPIQWFVRWWLPIDADLTGLKHSHDELLEALNKALSLMGGWREAIALTEDLTANSVLLKNMFAAINQIDAWVSEARKLKAKAERGNPPTERR